MFRLLADLSSLEVVNACMFLGFCGGITHCLPLPWTSAFAAVRGDKLAGRCKCPSLRNIRECPNLNCTLGVKSAVYDCLSVLIQFWSDENLFTADFVPMGFHSNGNKKMHHHHHHHHCVFRSSSMVQAIKLCKSRHTNNYTTIPFCHGVKAVRSTIPFCHGLKVVRSTIPFCRGVKVVRSTITFCHGMKAEVHNIILSWCESCEVHNTILPQCESCKVQNTILPSCSTIPFCHGVKVVMSTIPFCRSVKVVRSIIPFCHRVPQYYFAAVWKLWGHSWLSLSSDAALAQFVWSVLSDFLTRSIVSRAVGFECQHSFISRLNDSISCTHAHTHTHICLTTCLTPAHFHPENSISSAWNQSCNIEPRSWFSNTSF